MAQAKKSPSASAKLASAAANKAAKNTYAAVASTRSSAENVVKIGGRAAKDFLNQSAGEAQKAQDKILAMSRDGAEQFAKSADAVTKALYETIATSRDNIEAAVECGNVAAALAKDVSSELFEYANKGFTDSVEVSKDTVAQETEMNNMILRNLEQRDMRSAITDRLRPEAIDLAAVSVAHPNLREGYAFTPEEKSATKYWLNQFDVAKRKRLCCNHRKQ